MDYRPGVEGFETLGDAVQSILAKLDRIVSVSLLDHFGKFASAHEFLSNCEVRAVVEDVVEFEQKRTFNEYQGHDLVLEWLPVLVFRSQVSVLYGFND